MSDSFDSYEYDEPGDDRRWWPIARGDDRFGPALPHRAAELVYACLGPVAAHELLAALGSSKVTSSTLERLSEGLQQVDGRQPDMLVLLATAMGVVQREFNDPRPARTDSIDEEGGAGDSSAFIETYKHLGSLVHEAMQAFGFTGETFGEYLRDQWSGLGSGEWPPAGAAYTQREPATTAGDPDESPGDLWDRVRDSFGRPTMIGAHLAGASEQLESFTGRLTEAMQFVDSDLEEVWETASDAKRREFRARLEEAVGQVMAARDMVHRAEETMWQIFST